MKSKPSQHTPPPPRPRTKIQSTQDPDRRTITQSISFDWQIYELLEEERRKTRIEVPRSAYIRDVLEAHFRRIGRL